MKIGERQIGYTTAPFILAEMPGNPDQSLDRALAIVEAAARTGAHGLKLQTYTADTMTLDLADGEFFIADPNRLSCSTLYASGDLNQSVVAPVGAAEPRADR